MSKIVAGGLYESALVYALSNGTRVPILVTPTGLLVQCLMCQKTVKVNKWLLGGLHFCADQ